MQAVILVGEGRQLYPLADDSILPKPLLPIANQPMLAHLLQWLEDDTMVTHLLILVHSTESLEEISQYLTKVYEGTLIQKTTIEWIDVSNCSGTADALRMAKDKIRDDFVVMSCDLLTDLPLSCYLDVWRINQPLALMLLAEPPLLDAIAGTLASTASVGSKNTKELSFANYHYGRLNSGSFSCYADMSHHQCREWFDCGVGQEQYGCAVVAIG
jgi:translation initiation factor eIF-2B subunit gamma